MKKKTPTSRLGVAIHKTLPNPSDDIFKKTCQPKYYGLLEMRVTGEGQNKQSFFNALKKITTTLAESYDFDGELHDYMSRDGTVGFLFFFKLSRSDKANEFFNQFKALALDMARLRGVELCFETDIISKHVTDEWVADMDRQAGTSTWF